LLRRLLKCVKNLHFFEKLKNLSENSRKSSKSVYFDSKLLKILVGNFGVVQTCQKRFKSKPLFEIALSKFIKSVNFKNLSTIQEENMKKIFGFS
jgi:hypothetical protein